MKHLNFLAVILAAILLMCSKGIETGGEVFRREGGMETVPCTETLSEEPQVYDDYEPKLPDDFGFWFWIILPVGIFFFSPAGPIIALMLLMGIWLTAINEKLSKRRKTVRIILQAVLLVLIIAGGVYFWAFLL